MTATGLGGERPLLPRKSEEGPVAPREDGDLPSDPSWPARAPRCPRTYLPHIYGPYSRSAALSHCSTTPDSLLVAVGRRHGSAHTRLLSQGGEGRLRLPWPTHPPGPPSASGLKYHPIPPAGLAHACHATSVDSRRQALLWQGQSHTLRGRLVPFVFDGRNLPAWASGYVRPRCVPGRGQAGRGHSWGCRVWGVWEERSLAGPALGHGNKAGQGWSPVWGPTQAACPDWGGISPRPEPQVAAAGGTGSGCTWGRCLPAVGPRPPGPRGRRAQGAPCGIGRCLPPPRRCSVWHSSAPVPLLGPARGALPPVRVPMSLMGNPTPPRGSHTY